MTKAHKNEQKSPDHKKKPENRHERRHDTMPDGTAYKTNETLLDAGNLEDYNGPLSDSDSPLLEKNIASHNLSTDKQK
ncbi:hypothetical protein [Bartonella apis]|uniref:hypothetical protein n=1 Tax=Bartonella apis TaxID=1686310 RepID=UPI0026F3410C|nr:hypothetical protein [Bartonella apis]